MVGCPCIFRSDSLQCSTSCGISRPLSQSVEARDPLPKGSQRLSIFDFIIHCKELKERPSPCWTDAPCIISARPSAVCSASETRDEIDVFADKSPPSHVQDSLQARSHQPGCIWLTSKQKYLPARLSIQRSSKIRTPRSAPLRITRRHT